MTTGAEVPSILRAMPVVQRIDQDVWVVREDLLEGGSKIRFLPVLTAGADHVVFGGPFCGGAPLALSVLAKYTGLLVTLFYAQRKQWHPRQRQAQQNGARIIEVPFGYMSHVQAKARAFAQRAGALFLPLGFDVPAAQAPFVEAMRHVRRQLGDVAQVWCATGSGMLARCLGMAFPASEVCAVGVGLHSRHAVQPYPANVRLLETPYQFSQKSRCAVPFPACPYYEAKAWEMCQSMGRGPRLFWNVLGP